MNCGAIPEQLLESELFGYVEGAFSGARRGGKIGLFELAHRGTLFLDEIDSLPIMLQGKLLRVIQEKQLRRVGSESEVVVDIRTISATNKDVAALIQTKEFRADLFYRISTLTIHVPSLGARSDDMALLADHFIETYSKKYKKAVPALRPAQVDILKRHSWPGNIRELENVMHRYVLLHNHIADERLIEESIVGYSGVPTTHSNRDTISVRKDTLEQMERAIIVSALNEYRWDKQRAAERLGISRCTLWRKLKDE